MNFVLLFKRACIYLGKKYTAVYENKRFKGNVSYSDKSIVDCIKHIAPSPPLRQTFMLGDESENEDMLQYKGMIFFMASGGHHRFQLNFANINWRFKNWLDTLSVTNEIKRTDALKIKTKWVSYKAPLGILRRCD